QLLTEPDRLLKHLVRKGERLDAGRGDERRDGGIDRAELPHDVAVVEIDELLPDVRPLGGHLPGGDAVAEETPQVICGSGLALLPDRVAPFPKADGRQEELQVP